MAARKKKRSKAYRPKAVKAPNHLLVKLLPELTKEEHTKIELASLLPLDAIRRGEGTLENVDYVMNSLHVCWVCSAAFESDKDRCSIFDDGGLRMHASRE